VRSQGRYPRVEARLTFGTDGEVTLVAGDAPLPTPAEADAIKTEFADLEFPVTEPFRWAAKHLPCNDPNVPWSSARPSNLFVCWDRQHETILFVQERVDLRDGGKFYRPWSYWSDCEWRAMEPDGKLPLHGLDQLTDHSIVFVHEGAKAALAVRALLADPQRLKDHPWGEEFRYAAHLGWLGGANRAKDTDWSQLAQAGVQRVIIAADNDAEGHSTVPKISKLLADFPINVAALRFDDRWPRGFDLADAFPAELYEQDAAGRRAYCGPTFRDCLHPATWATRLGTPPPTRGRGRPAAPPVYLRDQFAREWWMVAGEGGAIFINQYDRSRLYAEEGFKNVTRPLSDTPRTAELFKESAYAQQVKAIAYEPGDKEGVITVEGDRCINTWTAPRIRPADGDPQPWLDFMEHLFPQPDDRLEVMRWCATLVARPRVRMRYGLLLSSTMQGVGKTTLCEIMRVLVGEKNARAPSAKDVVESAFNSWIVRKRLVFVNEIYEGGKWGAYQKLKTYITDRTLEANEKMIRSYPINNWAHFILCSNAEVPLWVEDDDRRFLVPEVSELQRPTEYWEGFYQWLASGGYAVIAGWADKFVAQHRAVKGDAPDSVRKRALIEDSRSSEELLVRSIAAAAKDRAGQVILVETDVTHWLESKTDRALKPSTIRGWLRKAGLCISSKRFKVDGRMTKVAGTQPMDDDMGWPDLAPHRAKLTALEPM
jgi:hypothetical protein